MAPPPKPFPPDYCPDAWAQSVLAVPAGNQIAQQGVQVYAAPGGGYLYRTNSILTTCGGDLGFTQETLVIDFPWMPGTREGAPIGNSIQVWMEFFQLTSGGPGLVCDVNFYATFGGRELVELFTNPQLVGPFVGGRFYGQAAKIAGQTMDRWTIKVKPNQNVQAVAYLAVGWTPGSDVPVVSYGSQVLTVTVKPGLILPTK